MTWHRAKKVVVISAGLAVLAGALPAQAGHEDRMTGGGFVDVQDDPDVHLGLDLPCDENQPPTAEESRFTVRWDQTSFHLEEVERADCTPDASTGGGTHDGSGIGRCETPHSLLGTTTKYDGVEIVWTLTDGGTTTPSSDTHGKPDDPGKPTDPGPAEPTQNPDMVRITIDGPTDSTIPTDPTEPCDLRVVGELQGGQLQLHTQS